MNLIDHFDKAVEADPTQICVQDAQERKTYADVQRDSFRIAHAIREMGFEPGTKVAMLSENTAAAFECLVGLLRAGCVWLPVGPNQTTEDTVAMLANSDAQLLLYSTRSRAAASEIVRSCHSLRKALAIDGDDRYAPSLMFTIRGAPDTDPLVYRASDDVVTLISSGGTTGRPKGAMMTNRCWETFIAGLMVRYYGVRPVHLISSPITHTAGGAAIAFSALSATTVLLERFDPERLMTAIERHRVTHLFLPPAAIRLMTSHPDVRNHDYSSLRFFIFGGAPMPVETLKEAVAIFGPVMTTAFGQTETLGDVTFMPPADIVEALAHGHEERLRSCGRATPFMKVAVMGDDGRLLKPREVGEIVVRGDQVMKGYYNDDAETERAALLGWHHTGDLGYRDEEGFFYLVDRKRDVIISGGFNVFPSVIERVVRQHPAVRECAVVGVPDEDFGEVPVAILEPHDGAVIDPAEVRALCEMKLSPLQRPRVVEIWPQLPRGHGGKLSRRFVRDRVLSGA
jgi:acyl-CoA synthetase (AMP-forming)/AMP-acid ligase II